MVGSSQPSPVISSSTEGVGDRGASVVGAGSMVGAGTDAGAMLIEADGGGVCFGASFGL